jgi:hypothetical protein
MINIKSPREFCRRLNVRIPGPHNLHLHTINVELGTVERRERINAFGAEKIESWWGGYGNGEVPLWASSVSGVMFDTGNESTTYGVECSVAPISIIKPTPWILRVTLRNLEVIAVAIPCLQAVMSLLRTATKVCLQRAVVPCTHIFLHTVSVSRIGKNFSSYLLRHCKS